jgi:hypothetical protein
VEPTNRSNLNTPLTNAGIDEALAREAAAHGYPTLDALLRIPLELLINADWITPPMWAQLVKIFAEMEAADRDERLNQDK